MKEYFSFIRGNVLVMIICRTLWRVSTGIVWPFLSLYVLALGGRYETIGMVMAIGSLAGTLLYPLGGYIADYQGRIKVMGYMTYIYSATFLLLAFTSSWEWLAVGMFAQSLVTFYTPVMQALMADSLPPDRRGIGFATAMAIPSAVGIASPMVGGWLIETLGIKTAMRGLYALGFFVGLVVATLRLRFLRETADRGRLEGLSPGGIPRMLVTAYRSVVETLLGAPRRVLTLSILVSACVFFVSVASPFWIVRAHEIIGITTGEWGTLMLVTGAMNVALSIPAGGVVDRLSKKWIAGVSLLLGSVSTLLFLRCTTFLHVLVLSAAGTLTSTFLNPAFQALFVDMTPRHQRGRIMASLGLGGVWIMGGAWGSGVLTMMSITAGSLFSGYVYDYNRALPWYILSAALAVLGILLIALVEEPGEVET